MLRRWWPVLALLLAAVGSGLLLRDLNNGQRTPTTGTHHEPDYYMDNFTRTQMDQFGKPKNRLSAKRLVHYPDDDSSELVDPHLQIYNSDGPPWNISADSAWVGQNNEVVLLHGDTFIWRDDAQGKLAVQVVTSNVRVLLDSRYADTDDYVAISDMPSVSLMTGVGMRADLRQDRLELMSHVRGWYENKPNH